MVRYAEFVLNGLPINVDQQIEAKNAKEKEGGRDNMAGIFLVRS